MGRLYGVAALSLLYASLGCAAGPRFDLFTAAEAEQWNSAAAQDSDSHAAQRDLRAPGAAPDCHDGKRAETSETPRIKIIAPNVGSLLTPPVDINIQFVPANGASIRPETFRLCYVGFVTVDITKRVTGHVEVSAEGLHVSGAQLPSGHHHLVMLIADNHGNFGRSEAQLDIQ